MRACCIRPVKERQLKNVGQGDMCSLLHSRSILLKGIKKYSHKLNVKKGNKCVSF